jgi:hypothetical protein
LIADTVLLGNIDVEQLTRQAEHDPVRSPVGQIQVRVVVALHHPVWIAPKVAPVILVDEAGGGDRRAGGQRTHFGLLAIVQRPVEGQELVVLVLAHRPSR